MFSGAIAPIERIYSLRGEATGFYRAVHPLLAVISMVERTEPKKLRLYLRDVHDHLSRVDEGIADQRELLRQVLEANMAVISVEQTRVSVQQDRTMQQLTILATIFLPLTFITGFFGQNFGWLVQHIAGDTAFIVYGLGGLAVPLALLITWMRLRMPHVDTGAVPGQTAGAGHQGGSAPASASSAGNGGGRPASRPGMPGPAVARGRPGA